MHVLFDKCNFQCILAFLWESRTFWIGKVDRLSTHKDLGTVSWALRALQGVRQYKNFGRLREEMFSVLATHLNIMNSHFLVGRYLWCMDCVVQTQCIQEHLIVTLVLSLSPSSLKNYCYVEESLPELHLELDSTRWWRGKFAPINLNSVNSLYSSRHWRWFSKSTGLFLIPAQR